jgi:hypothetical protein
MNGAVFEKVDDMRGEEEEVKYAECARRTEFVIRKDASIVGDALKTEERANFIEIARITEAAIIEVCKKGEDGEKFCERVIVSDGRKRYVGPLHSARGKVAKVSDAVVVVQMLFDKET